MSKFKNKTKDNLFLIISILFFFSLNCIEVNSATSTNPKNLDRLEAVDKYISSELKKSGAEGVNIGIVNKDGIIAYKSYGNIASIDSPLVIGSNSKSFTALAIMQLVDDELVSLQEKIITYLGEEFLNVDNINEITVSHLLNHTSGIDAFYELNNFKIDKKKIGQFQYSNVNYHLLGIIIENVTRDSFSEYVKKNIFIPLNMNTSFASLEDAKEKGLEYGYQNYFGINFKNNINKFNDEDYKTSSGYIVSSTTDMGNYLSMYLNLGEYNGNKLITTDSINKMIYDGIDAKGDKSTTDEFEGEPIYGMGWIKKNSYGTNLIYHTGKVQAYTSTMALLPEEDLGVFIIFNSGDFLIGTPMMESLSQSIISILIGKVPNPLDENSFLWQHLFLDAILLVLFIMSVNQFIKLSKWRKKKEYFINKRKKYILITLITDFLLPIVIIGGYKILSIPLKQLIDFIPDVVGVFSLCIILLLISGVYKMIILSRRGM